MSDGIERAQTGIRIEKRPLKALGLIAERPAADPDRGFDAFDAGKPDPMTRSVPAKWSAARRLNMGAARSIFLLADMACAAGETRA